MAEHVIRLIYEGRLEVWTCGGLDGLIGEFQAFLVVFFWSMRLDGLKLKAEGLNSNELY